MLHTNRYQDFKYSSEENIQSLPSWTTNLIGRGMDNPTTTILPKKYRTEICPGRLREQSPEGSWGSQRRLQKKRLACCLFSSGELAEILSSTLFDTSRASLKCELDLPTLPLIRTWLRPEKNEICEKEQRFQRWE